LAVCVLGCQEDPARDRSSRSVKTLVDTRGSLISAERNVAGSLEALRTLRESQGDLREPFAAFRKGIDSVRPAGHPLTVHANATDVAAVKRRVWPVAATPASRSTRSVESKRQSSKNWLNCDRAAIATPSPLRRNRLRRLQAHAI
jgi:hypothetical protein